MQFCVSGIHSIYEQVLQNQSDKSESSRQYITQATRWCVSTVYCPILRPPRR